MAYRPCLSCGRVSPNSRCEPCRIAYERTREARRGSPAQRGYNYAHRKARAAVMARDGWRCYNCGSPATTADHVVPLSRGGQSVPENMRAACRSCNSARANRMRARVAT